MQRSVHVLTVDAVVRIAKESLDVDQIVSRSIVACGLVVFVEELLRSNRYK